MFREKQNRWQMRGTGLPPIATDESQTSGLVQGGSENSWSSSTTHRPFYFLSLPVLFEAAVSDSAAAPLLTVTTAGQANRDAKAAHRRGAG